MDNIYKCFFLEIFVGHLYCDREDKEQCRDATLNGSSVT